MFISYLKIALRHFSKWKIFSVINILGLSVGVTCCMFILIYIGKEISYDSFHKKSDRIYRISLSLKSDNGWTTLAHAPYATGTLIKSRIPEVEAIAQLSTLNSETIVEYKDVKMYEPRFVYVSPDFFEVFDFQVLSGNSFQSLQQPYNVFLSESMAKKYFKNESPVDKELVVNNEETYTVAGIFKDVPENSHIKFDFVASQESLRNLGLLDTDNWYKGGASTYVLLNENADKNGLKTKLSDFRDEFMVAPFASKKGEEATISLVPVPLNKIHLYTDFVSELVPQGDITSIYIFSGIALLILVIACINYLNLATALGTRMAKEIGVRKVIGAKKSELIKQYLTESFLYVSIAFILSIVLVIIFLPIFNSVMQQNILIEWNDYHTIIGFGLFWLLIGLLAGIYPALYLSNVQPIAVLKGIGIAGTRSWHKNILIIFQLTISIVLIASAIIIHKQMKLVTESRLDNNKEQVVIIPTQNKLGEEYHTLRERLLSYIGINSVTTCSFEPGQPGFITFLSSDDIEGFSGNEKLVLDGIIAGFDFIKTFGLQLVAGRSFNEDFMTDIQDGVMINEVAVNAFGWDNPVKMIDYNGRQRQVIGIVKDFNYKSLEEKIAPLIITPTNLASKFVAIRINPNDVTSTVNEIKKVWEETNQELPFSYVFLDDLFDSLYKTEIRLNLLVTIFSALAIFIACMGLLGLSMFIAEQRTKEIGLRLTLGASVQNIMILLIRGFVKRVFIGFIIAIPLVSFIMEKWLQKFIYRVEIENEVYFLACTIVLILVITSVSWQTIRLAFMNPVDALRNE